MKPVTEPKLFVEPRNYRARRMVDGLRVLPMAGDIPDCDASCFGAGSARFC